MNAVVNLIGRLTAALGLSMLIPATVDWADESGGWAGMVISATITTVIGALLMTATRRQVSSGLTRQEAFLLTILVWLILPIFGALPFVLAAPLASYTDAFFEAMSGLTTTGATVFTGLEEAPRGMLLWRAMLQWFGGVGIVVVAMVFLPVLKIGGMQFFRSESFDLVGSVLPSATQIAGALFGVYAGLTVACMLAYHAAGLTDFDALCHAMTTVSTGGMGNYDDSFSEFPAAAQYVAIVFMALGAVPFIVLIQLARGSPKPMFRDPQIRTFLTVILVTATIMVLWLLARDGRAFEPAVRAALFNVTSILTGTGYASEDFNAWGGFPVTLFLMLALIGGCTGSTACSAKIFRYQILFAALAIQIRRIHMPNAMFPLRYDGRPVEADVLSSVMGYFFVFAGAIVVWAILLSMVGLDTITAISGAVASLANVGPGLGEMIGPDGNYAEVPVEGKWILAMGMLLGRLEFMSVLVLLTPMFWRR